MLANAPLWAWGLLVVAILAMIATDALAHRGDRVDSPKRALAWSGVWIAVAVAFGVFVALRFGRGAGEAYFAAYLVEKSLSVDNLFLFLAIFAALDIPRSEQRRVLTWGILGALVTRGLFIAIGSVVIARWHAVTYGLGVLLVVTAIKMFRGTESKASSRFLGWLERHLPWTRERHGHKFVVRAGGRWLATPLLLALFAIEGIDLVLALDSVPAAFAITNDPFIIYSSNVFAVLGLRALYIVLASALVRIRYLNYGLSVVIAFTGAKMLLSSWVTISAGWSVAIVAACLVVTVVASRIGGGTLGRAGEPPGPL